MTYSYLKVTSICVTKVFRGVTWRALSIVEGVSSLSFYISISANSLKAGQHSFSRGRVAHIFSAISISSISLYQSGQNNIPDLSAPEESTEYLALRKDIPDRQMAGFYEGSSPAPAILLSSTSIKSIKRNVKHSRCITLASLSKPESLKFSKYSIHQSAHSCL